MRIKNTFNIVLHQDHCINEPFTLFEKLPETLAKEMKDKFGGNTPVEKSGDKKKPKKVAGKPDLDYLNSIKPEQLDTAIQDKVIIFYKD